MAEEYRYPLTRICLRNGALTLPRTMLGLFPEEGAITAVDSESGEEFQLEARGPRTVVGIGPFLDAHELDVNDELLIRPLEDGRFGFTAFPRPRKRDYASPNAVAALLAELAQGELAANEAEIRALYPEFPADFDLRGMLETDDRFVWFEGRWHARAALERRIDDEEVARRKGAKAKPQDAGEAPVARAGGADAPAQGPQADAAAVDERDAEAAEAVPVPVPRSDRTQAGAEPARSEAMPGERTGARPTEAELRPLEAGESQQDALWRSTWQTPDTAGETAHPAWQPTAFDDAGPAGAPSAPGDDERRSLGPSVRERRAPRVVFPGDEALSREGEEEAEELDLQHVSRARELLQRFGFRLEGLGKGDLVAHAELGRRGYTVLVHALAFGQRLDWAALLARRREVGARYLAVFGDRRDLNRLQSPAELARATLWSWEGLHRATALSRSVPISPFDLQLHFEREGLFGHGLERFESDVAELVAERGAFSEVLSLLAGMRAPTVFLLEDLASQGTLSRDVVLKVLERLAEAPFHLVARVAQGEFCLRQPVSEGLANLADYASSLRGRLPSRGRERLTGLGEPELLEEDDLFGDADADAEVEAEVEAASGADAAVAADDGGNDDAAGRGDGGSGDGGRTGRGGDSTKA